MSCSGRGTLIIPDNDGPPLILGLPYAKGSSRFSLFVTEVFVLPVIGDLLPKGPGQKQISESRSSVFRGCPKFRMLSVRLDFR